MELLKGAPAAKAITEQLKETVAGMECPPKLAFVRIGEDPGDLSYENSAKKRMDKIGIAYETYAFPADIDNESFLRELAKINADDSVDGILLFRPLPKQIDSIRAAKTISPEKDMDGFHPDNLERLFEGKDCVAPCTPQAVMEILKHYGISVSGKRTVVVGRSMVLGRPLSMMLLSENATVTICHSKTQDLPEVCREADILIAAVGHAGLITKEYVKEGAVVVDVGINVMPDGSVKGDVDADSVTEQAGFLTPVPGGVGTVTTSVLAKHVTEACLKRRAQNG